MSKQFISILDDDDEFEEEADEELTFRDEVGAAAAG